MTTEDENNQEIADAGAVAEATEAPAEVAETAPPAEDAAPDSIEASADAASAEAKPEADAADAPTADQPSEEGKDAVGEDYDPSVAGAAAHLIGVSRPQDEYGTREIDRDAMSDDELLAMGVEPDEGPGTTLVGVFVSLTFILIFTGVAVAALFGWVADSKNDALSDRTHPALEESRAASAAVLNAYAQVPGEEGVATTYRIPIDVAMDLLVDEPSWLGRHPLGVENAELEPPDVPEPPRAVVAPTSINAHGGVGQAVPPTVAGPSGTVVLQPQGAPANTLPTPNAVDPHAGHDHHDEDHDPHTGHDH